MIKIPKQASEAMTAGAALPRDVQAKAVPERQSASLSFL
jgi:hypothetical protein